MSFTFVHLSDTHFGTDEEFRVQNIRVIDRVAAVVDAVRNLPFRPEFVLHSGDLTHRSEHGANGGYKLLEQTFSAINLPVYYLCGNHDDRDAMRSILTYPDVEWISTTGGRLDYRFQVKGVSILALDARSSEAAEGELLPEQLELVRAQVERNKNFLLFIHYLAFDIGVPWYLGFPVPDGMDRMVIRNGEALHALLVKAEGRCGGVFSGHLHCAHTVTRDGILYSTAPAASVQIGGWPGLAEVVWQLEARPGFNVVHVGTFGTKVTPYTVSV